MADSINQNVADALSHPTWQKLVALLTTGGGLAYLLNFVSDFLAVLSIVAGLLVALSMLKKNKAETRRATMETALFKAEKDEIEARRKSHKPLRRRGDK